MKINVRTGPSPNGKLKYSSFTIMYVRVKRHLMPQKGKQI